MVSKSVKALLDDKYYSHISVAVQKEFIKKSTIDLLKILEKMTTRTYVESKYGDYVEDEHGEEYRRYEAIRYIVLQRLGLIDQGDIIAVINTHFGELEKKIEDQIKMNKNHRHRGLMGTYTEKPVY